MAVDQEPVCWEAHPPLVTNHFFAARRYIPSSRMLGAGLPHNKSLSQRCRTSCYKPMSRNGRPSLLQTKYLLFTVIQQNQYNVHPKALIFHCLAAGTVTSNHLEDGLALPGEKGTLIVPFYCVRERERDMYIYIYMYIHICIP